MKKKSVRIIVVLFLSALMAICLFACNKNEQKTPGSSVTGTSASTAITDNSAEPSVNMTESYSKGRKEFKAVTGIELPALENVVVEEFPYEEGATSYELDITENVTKNTFDTLSAFLDTTLASWKKEGPSTDGEYTNVWYRNNSDSIGITWDNYNKAVYVHAIMGGSEPTKPDTSTGPADSMTDSYRRGREQFHTVSGIWLPELENLELDAASSFDTVKKAAELIVGANGEVFAEMVNAVKKELAYEPLSNNKNHWEQEGWMAFWEWEYEAEGRTHKVTIQLENNSYTGKITVGYWLRDYYTLTLTAGQGGTARVEIAGRAQDGNTANVCYNTYSELYATPSLGYEFAGFYEGATKLSDDNPLEYMIVKDVSIEARFTEIPSDMDAGYKAARAALYDMSGIILPASDDVVTNEDSTQIEFDTEDGVRDYYQCEFVFATSDEAAAAYADFQAAVIDVEGEQEESMEGMDLWSVLYPDAAIPYRDDVMMHINERSIFLMWRKQPIAFYSVAVEGNGSAYAVYTGSDYNDRYVERYWEIVDAFHGKVVATADQGNKFVGWFVDGVAVSSDATYIFNYYHQTIDFTEITFVAKFEELPASAMTDSYRTGREAFETITGFTLPELEDCEVLGSSDLRTEQHTVACFDITGTADDMASINSSLQLQVGHEPSYEDELGTTWQIEVQFGEDWYIGQIWTMLDAGEYEGSAYSFVYVNYCVEEVSESYVAGRKLYFEVTGLELPLLAGVEAETSPYTPGESSGLEVDINSDATTDMFDKIVAFFDSLEGWEKQDTIEDGEYINQFYTSDAGMIGVTWDGYNNGLYIHFDQNS